MMDLVGVKIGAPIGLMKLSKRVVRERKVSLDLLIVLFMEYMARIAFFFSSVRVWVNDPWLIMNFNS